MQSHEGPNLIREHRSPWGTLRFVLRDDRVIEHPVKDEVTLRTLAHMWEHLQVEVFPQKIDEVKKRVRGRGTCGVGTGTSALQQMIQHELGIENFWFAVADNAALVERAMEAWQAALQKCYDSLGQFDVDCFFQDENTSTTAISPAFYEKYSVGQIRQYTRAVAPTGKPSIVHMCGLLKDLLPLFPKTGLTAIDCLTPPPMGNCPFEDAYEAMPQGFFCTGRLNSQLWIGRSREEILHNLSNLLPHRIYREYPFILAVTADGIDNVSPDNWRLVRDCINEYEQAG